MPRTRSHTSSQAITHADPQDAVNRQATAHHGHPATLAPTGGTAALT
jgi:hypothetical protein